MLKKALSILTALLSVLLLTGCSQDVTGDRTVIDPAGDKVIIPDEITGIIARVNTASYVAAMGHADLINKLDITATVIKKLDLSAFTNGHILESAEYVFSKYEELGGNSKEAKGAELIKNLVI